MPTTPVTLPCTRTSAGLEKSFQALMQQTHVGVAQCDVTGRFVAMNARWAEMLGYTEAETLQLNVREVTHPESAAATAARFDLLSQGIENETDLLFEKRYVRKDGTTFWGSVTATVLREPTGELRGFVTLAVDISEQRRSRRVAETQNDALQLILNGAPLPEVFRCLVSVVDAEDDSVGCILLLDQQKKHFRVGAAPGLPQAYNDAVEEVPVGAAVGTCADAAATNEVVITPDLAAAPSWKNFSHLPLSLGLHAAWSMPIVSAQGDVLGTFGSYFRRTRRPTESEIRTVGLLAKVAAIAIERSRSQESLRTVTSESSRLGRVYEAALSTTPDFIYVFDLAHRFVYANKALLEIWGKSWDEAAGKTCLELGYEPWHAAMHDREIEQVIATRRSIRGDVAFTGLTGTRMYDYIFSPVIGESGEVEAISGTTRDVTDKRRSEAAIRFLGDLTQELSLLNDEREIIRHAANALGRHLNAHRCFFVECLETDELARISESYLRDIAPLLPKELPQRDFIAPTWWQVFDRGVVSVEDIRNNPLVAAAAVAHYEALEIRSYTMQPIKRTGKNKVGLALTDNRPRWWTEDEVRLQSEVAARVWPLVERARSEAALRLARDEALAASRAKDDFLAALSHELRTPLNPVLLLASEAAANPRLSDEVRADFDTIARNVSLEKRLIDDLLDLTGITHNKVVLDLGLHDVHALLDQAAANVEPELRHKELQLIAHFDAPRFMVEGDGMRLQQVFWNVLKNAAKFTPSRGHITVRTSVSASKANTIVIEVTDTGIGLTAEEQRKVFAPFIQGEHAERNGAKLYGGLGLGLAISRKLTELHSGTIAVSSKGRNQGATFTIELPLFVPAAPTPVARAATPPVSSESSPPVASKRRVLLVEDHEPSRLALARLLGYRKIEVVHAATVREALEKAALQPVDLVISDIGLPDGDGYQLMTLLRERHGFRGIALSGYGADADIGRSQAAGFLAHLTKPVRIQALETLLEKHAASGPTT